MHNIMDNQSEAGGEDYGMRNYGLEQRNYLLTKRQRDILITVTLVRHLSGERHD